MEGFFFIFCDLLVSISLCSFFLRECFFICFFFTFFYSVCIVSHLLLNKRDLTIFGITESASKKNLEFSVEKAENGLGDCIRIQNERPLKKGY